MNRDQYINEVRRKSLLHVFNAMRRIIVHPLNVSVSPGYLDELHSAGCSALEYAQVGRVPVRLSNKRTPFGSVMGKRPTTCKWAWEVRWQADTLWEAQRPDGESGYWWPCQLQHGAVQHRLRAIDNIIKDLTPAAVSRNKREGKRIVGLTQYKAWRYASCYGSRRKVRFA